jgi:phage shock protein C
MEEKKLRRSNDKMIAGVCAGLAEYFGIDPVIVRIIFVILLVAGGPGFLIYIIMWIVMPAADAPAVPPSTPPAA